VTSVRKWPAPPSQANAIVPVGRCRYAETIAIAAAITC
jgi:hypothetical protein